MIVKAKRMNGSDVLRLAAGGKIKEVILNEELSEPSQGGVQICFRGEKSSGVVELNEIEAKELHKTLGTKLKLIGKVKVYREKN